MVTTAPGDVVKLFFPSNPEARLKRGLFAALWITFIFFGSTPSWNPNTRFDLVRAIVEEGRVAIDSYHQNTGDKAQFDGHTYSDKAPGISLLAVPIYFLRQLPRVLDRYSAPSRAPELAMGALYLCTIFTVGLLAAALGVALFCAARRLGAGATAALWVALAYSLGTPALAYSSLFFAHQAAAALLFIPFTLLLLAPDPVAPKTLFAVGLLTGLAVICEYPAGIGAVAITAYAIWRLERPLAWRPVAAVSAWIAAGALLPAVLGGTYNAICFGAPWRIGYSTLVPSRFADGMSHGFFGIGTPTLEAAWGITFGGLRGLFPLSPILLVALGGSCWAAARSRWKDPARVALTIVVAFFVLNASYQFWNGGAAFGPRHIVPMLPFLALGLVAVPVRPRWWLGVLVAITGLSIANAVAASAVGADLPEHGNVLRDHIWPRIVAGEIPFERDAYNLGNVLGLHGLWSLTPLAFFWLASAPLLHRLSVRARGGSA